MHSVAGSSGCAVMFFKGMGGACRGAGRGEVSVIAGCGDEVGGFARPIDVSFVAVRRTCGLSVFSGVE